MPGLKERAKTLVELADGASFLFAERPLSIDEKAAALLGATAKPVLHGAHAALKEVDGDWTVPARKLRIREFAERQRPEARRGGAAAACRADGKKHLAGRLRRACRARPR